MAAWPCRFRSGRYTSLPPDIVSLIYHPSIFLLISPPALFTFHPSFYHYFTIYSRPRKARICSANTVVIHWLIQQVLLLFFLPPMILYSLTIWSDFLWQNINCFTNVSNKENTLDLNHNMSTKAMVIYDWGSGF